jgi:hypothetical protein
MKRGTVVSVLGFAAAVSLAAPMLAQAQWRGGGPRHGFYGRDFRYFGPHELGVWRGGAWRHDWYGGRYGWWWVADGFWYFYPEPIYPYPTYVPPAIVVQQAPPTPAGLPPAQFWYYCPNPQGYYPYVASCSVAWQQVSANAPAQPPEPQATPTQAGQPPSGQPDAAPPPAAPSR